MRTHSGLPTVRRHGKIRRQTGGDVENCRGSYWHCDSLIMSDNATHRTSGSLRFVFQI